MSKRVVIVGAGGAGLVAALSAQESGADVLVISKEYPTRSQTCMAQGGINAVLAVDDSEGIEMHIQDTLRSANALADAANVRFMCREAPHAIRWLDSIGVPFSRTKESDIAQRKLGGASVARACYAQDYTGLKILHTLYDQCVARQVEFLNERYLLDFITKKDAVGNIFVCGVSVLNKRSGEIEIYEASSIVLATGGYAGVYGRHATNSSASTGDGIAAALRAGAKASDMEFVQFHPTALKSSSILISESARGAGGKILNAKGERFVDELAPRDVVSKAIDNAMRKGEAIFLDIRHLGADFIQKELPQEQKLIKLYENIDPAFEPIPIKPSAHYTMGGVDVDADCATHLAGLYAVGECANHRVHGANRLGGNSLLEIVVFAKKAGSKSAEYAKAHDIKVDLYAQKRYFEEQIANILAYETVENFYKKQRELGDLFYQNAGIQREKTSMEKCLLEVRKMRDSLKKSGVSNKIKEYNTNLIDFLEFQNMLELSELILLCAIKREESRGAHYRVDFKENDEIYRAHSIITRDKEVYYED